MGAVFQSSVRSAVTAGWLRRGRSSAQGYAEMKVRVPLLKTSDNSRSGNERVWVEIYGFLKALDSYPDRFAQDPGVTFDEHRRSVMALSHARPRRRA
jgi:hypothetical protein